MKLNSRFAYQVLILTCTLFGYSLSQADDYQHMLKAVDNSGSVEILVSQWRPISGEIDAGDLGSAITGEINPADSTQKLVSFIRKHGGKVQSLRQFKYLKLSAISVDKTGLMATQDYLKNGRIWANNQIELYLADSIPSLGVPKYWDKGHRGTGQIVAVIDTGVDVNHPFIRGRIIGEACFAATCPNVTNEMVGNGAAFPVASHGTHVAGIIAGSNANMQGVAPKTGILAINVFSNINGSITARDADILAALDYVAAQKKEHNLPIAAVNLSLGGGPLSTSPCDNTPYQEIAQILEKAGVAVVAASGNSNIKTGMRNPACSSAVISVGAIDKFGQVAPFSNSVSFMDIWAPGVKIISSVWQGDHDSDFAALSGTSMAAPHVAGAFAILRGVYPNKSVRDLLKMQQIGTPIQDPANDTVIPSLQLNPQTNPVDKNKPPPPADIAPKPSGGTTAITG